MKNLFINPLAGTMLLLAACEGAGSGGQAAATNVVEIKANTARADQLKGVMEEVDRTWDFKPLIDILAPDVQFKATIPAGTPISGEFRGKEAVANYFNVILQGVAEFKQQVPMEFIQTGNRVIILGDDAYTVKKTGEQFSSPYSAIFTFENELIKDILIIQDLTGIWNAYRQEK